MRRMFGMAVVFCGLFLCLLQVLTYAEPQEYQGVLHLCWRSGNTLFVEGDENVPSAELSLNTKMVTYNGREMDIDAVLNYELFKSNRSGQVTAADRDGDGLYEDIAVKAVEAYVVAENNPDAGRLIIKNAIGERTLLYTDIRGVTGAVLEQLGTGEVLELEGGLEDFSWPVDINVLKKTMDGRIASTGISGNSWSPTGGQGKQFGFSAVNPVWYQAAYGAYGYENIRAGYSGAFCLDRFGRLAAFFWDGYNSLARYGVVLDEQAGQWYDGRPFKEISILMRWGIQTYKLADKIQIGYPEEGEEYLFADDFALWKERLMGKMVRYEVNEENEINFLEFAGSGINGQQLTQLNQPGECYTYKREMPVPGNRETFGVFIGTEKSFRIDEGTQVFYAYRDPEGNAYGFSPRWSAWGKIEQLEEKAYLSPIFYDPDPENGCVNAMVIYDDNPYPDIRLYNAKGTEFFDDDKDPWKRNRFIAPSDQEITAMLNPKYRGSTLMLAGYKDDVMIGLARAEGQEIVTLPVEMASGIPDRMKAFVWKDFADIEPVGMRVLEREWPEAMNEESFGILEDTEISFDGTHIYYYGEKWREEGLLAEDVHFVGFRSDGEEGFDKGKWLDNYIGHPISLRYDRGVITQVNLLCRFLPGEEGAPKIEIGGLIDQSVKISDRLAFYVGDGFEAEDGMFHLKYIDGEEWSEETYAAAKKAMAARISYANREICICWDKISGGEYYDGKVILREYDGEITHAVMIQ